MSQQKQGRVVQMSEDEAARVRGSRKVVDAEVVRGSDRTAAPEPPPGGVVGRVARAVVGGAQAVGRAAVGAVEVLRDNREQVGAAAKAAGVAAAGWAVEAAKDAARREVQRRVAGAFGGGGSKPAQG